MPTARAAAARPAHELAQLDNLPRSATVVAKALHILMRMLARAHGQDQRSVKTTVARPKRVGLMLGSENRAIARQLSAYATFAGCTEDDLVALAQAGARFSLPPGWTLVQEGIPSDACYVIMEGTAKVYRERAEIAALKPGDVVGEMTLLAGGQRRATVTSVTHISGLRIENDALAALVSQRPRLREALTAVYHAHQSGQD